MRKKAFSCQNGFPRSLFFAVSYGWLDLENFLERFCCRVVSPAIFSSFVLTFNVETARSCGAAFDGQLFFRETARRACRVRVER